MHGKFNCELTIKQNNNNKKKNDLIWMLLYIMLYNLSSLFLESTGNYAPLNLCFGTLCHPLKLLPNDCIIYKFSGQCMVWNVLENFYSKYIPYYYNLYMVQQYTTYCICYNIMTFHYYIFLFSNTKIYFIIKIWKCKLYRYKLNFRP